MSERGMQLREKQKARYSYAMMERQFRRFFALAEKRPGTTGDNFLQLLETRLDNVVYRLGFANSHHQARQIVRHGHITLNGRKVDIPSYLVKPGDTITWRERSTKTELYKEIAQEIEDKVIPSWLSLDKEKLSGKVLSLPTRDEIDTRFDEKTIVEYYSR
jgi:small subunit ribosomal protein S4